MTPSSRPAWSTTGSRLTLVRAMVRAACARVVPAPTVRAGEITSSAAVTELAFARSDRRRNCVYRSGSLSRNFSSGGGSASETIPITRSAVSSTGRAADLPLLHRADDVPESCSSADGGEGTGHYVAHDVRRSMHGHSSLADRPLARCHCRTGRTGPAAGCGPSGAGGPRCRPPTGRRSGRIRDRPCWRWEVRKTLRRHAMNSSPRRGACRGPCPRSTANG